MNATGITLHEAHGPVCQTEEAIDTAISEYCTHNGVAMKVAYGVWLPPEGFDVSCVAGEDLPDHLGAMAGRRAIIETPLTSDQGVVGISDRIVANCHETPVALRGDPVAECRSAVERALIHQTAWLRRLQALTRHGVRACDPPPLWSLRVHPVVKALAGDLASAFGIDPRRIKTAGRVHGRRDIVRTNASGGIADSGHARPLHPTDNAFRIDGGRLIASALIVSPEAWIEQDSTGVRLHVAYRLPRTMLTALPGTPVGRIVDAALPERIRSIPVRTAIHDAAGTSMLLAEAWTEADVTPDRDEGWRLPPKLPPHWKTVGEPLPERSEPLEGGVH